MTFNFDEWVDLYKTDPHEFECRRSERIEQMISAAAPERQHRLRQLQWKLDVIHKTQSPLKATVTMSKMMMDTVLKLDTHLVELSEQAVAAAKSMHK